MQALIDGKAVALQQIAARAHKFGNVAAGQRLLGATLVLSLADVASKFAQFYQEYAHDDAEHGEDDEHAFVLELRRLGWPPLITVLRQHPRLFEQFAHNVAYDLMLSLLPSAPNGPHYSPRYFVNELIKLTVLGEQVTLHARVIDIGAR